MIAVRANKNKNLMFALSLAFLASSLVLPLRAQQSPDDFANSGEDLGQYLGPIYKDEVAGIKIAPPVGSRIINRAGLDLVSFVNDAKQWGGDVQMVMVKQKMSIADYLTSTAGELGKTFRDVQVIDSRELTFQGHDAGRISISMQAELGAIAGKKNTGGPAEIVSLFRQQLVVQLAEQSVSRADALRPAQGPESGRHHL